MRQPKTIIKSYLRHAIIAIDLLIVLFSGIFSHFIRFIDSNSLTNNIKTNSLWEILISGLLLLIIFNKNGIYHNIRGKNFKNIIISITKSWCSWILILCLFAFLTRLGGSISRLWLAIFGIQTLSLIILQRFIIHKSLIFMRKNGFNQKNILFIGTESENASIKNHLNSKTWTGFKISEFLNTKSKVLYDNKLNDFIKSKNISEIWVGLSVSQNKDKNKNKANKLNVLNILRTTCLQIRLIPILPESDLNLLNHSITEMANIPVINLRVSPLFGFNKIIKDIEDKLLATLILILISPIMLIIASIIKLTSKGKGPVFYKQERLSWNGKPFNILKFRSMPIDSENKSGAVRAKAEDKRSTKFGAFLRKTSLDELPQFINVLKGDMSIVGPRPERPIFVEKFKDEIPGYMEKHLIKAGITGWAQINGWRGNTDLNKRIEHDLHYIDNWSLLMDLKIIIMTIFKGIYNKNAY